MTYSIAQMRRLARVAGSATGLPVPAAVDVGTGVWDAFAGSSEELSPTQRIGRAIGYSRNQVGAPRAK